MVWSSLAPKWPILVPFYRMYHQKSNFSLILAPFLSEAVEASRCHFFENWLMKHKFPNLLKPLGTIIQQNYWSFYPSDLIYFAIFTMRHPVARFSNRVKPGTMLIEIVLPGDPLYNIKMSMYVSVSLKSKMSMLVFVTYWYTSKGLCWSVIIINTT